MNFEHLQKTVGTTPAGKEWLKQLPQLIERTTSRWQLTVQDVVTEDATASWVAHCLTLDKEPAVIKIGFPHTEARDEIPGLLAWQRHSAVTMIEYDVVANALLMRRCEPGTTLRQHPETIQDEVIASMLKRLWTANPETKHPFRPLSDMVEQWLSELAEDRRKDDLTRRGIETYYRMLASTGQTVLMPTDLHAGNILTNSDGWTLIDPKPYIGDPAYDVTQHLLNCTERLMSDPLALIDRMASLTDQDPDRIRSWLFARLSCASARTDDDVVLAQHLEAVPR
ncbi:MAG: aminoglycoside phosphotransferase family protein [Pseudomonadota bacterium]